MNFQNVFKFILLTYFAIAFGNKGYAQFVILTELPPLGNTYPASVRAASMGFAGVANGGNVQEVGINPASLGLMESKFQTEFSHSSPVCLERNGNTYFAGFGYKFNRKLSMAISSYNYYCKNPEWAPSFNGFNSDATVERESFITLTTTWQIINGLYFGVNMNLLNYALLPYKASNSFLVDPGLIYEKTFSVKEGKDILSKSLRLGVSYSNIANAKTKWIFPMVDHPIHITNRLMGGACFLESVSLKKVVYGNVKLVPSEARTIDFLIQMQYLKYMNWSAGNHESNPYFWGLSAGAEIVFLKLLAFRFGYRYELRAGNNEPFGVTNYSNYPYLKGFTWGTGIIIPTHHLGNEKCPFDLAIDYMFRKPFQWLKENPYISEYPVTNISLRLNWFLK